MIYLGADHQGYQLKEAIKAFLTERGLAFEDLGTDSEESADFPTYAIAVAERVVDDRANQEDSIGVVICGSGIGVDIAANKVNGARAALATTEYMGKQSREHDDANILALGAQVVTEQEALAILDAFLGATFDGIERHARRVEMISKYEEQR